MCGISGLFEYRRKEELPRDVIHRMNESIKHRGPDDEGIFVDGGVGLGHRRLSIIDVAGGHQPLCNEDETVWVLLNGEIYNFQELHQELVSLNHRFRTRSDTEAIVHLYEEYGEECFARLRGMFAIAIWDSRNRKLLLARDRIGEKPLFYSADSHRIVFGSELKALLASELISKEIDPLALSDYFSYGYISSPKSIYKSVRKLRPGHFLVAAQNGVRECPYWDISFSPERIESRSVTDWSEAIRHQLCDSTRAQLMSDVPLGAFLSGGVDSSSIVAMMSHLMDRPVTTCSIGFPNKEFDESDYARQIARKFNTDHFEEIVAPSALEIMPKLVWHYDEPFADSSAIPTYYVSRVARQRVTVALGGDGGDENFGGYRRYRFDLFENSLRNAVPGWIRTAICGPLGRIYPGLAWAPRVFRAKATLQSLARNPLEGYFNSVSIFRPDEKRRLLSHDFQRSIDGYDSVDVFKHHYDRVDSQDPLTKIQYVDMKTYLPDDIFTKVDRAAMAVSLEVRAPLVDHRLMELVARIPSNLKIRRGEGKFILKEAMKSMLPENVLYRRKQGFAVPLKHWFRGELKDATYSTMFSQDDGILDKSYLRKIWNQHQSGTFDRSAYLWCVLMYCKWKEAFQA
jgi:asparagine synthase (glutamine-hydrolysing)